MPVTFQDLIDETTIILHDSSTDFQDLIPVKLNEAMFAVADEAVSSGGIPELKRIGIFTTVPAQAWTNLPTGFNGKLLFVGNEEISLAIADGGVQQLMEINPLLDEEGLVHTVALEGTILYYQGIPSIATNYPILYQVWPTELVAASDPVPAWVPQHLQRGLFIHKAAALIYNLIEDGIEGEKVNTQAQLMLHNGYVTQYLEYLGRRRPGRKTSAWMV